MNDDIEDRLRKYRPSGPPPELRDRVLAGVARPFQGRVREWLPATIAASIAIVFHLLAAHAHADVTSRLAVDHVHEAMVADLASQLGGDEFARQSAEQLIEASEQAASGEPSDSGGIDVQVTNHD